MNYVEFLKRKTQFGSDGGFEPIWMPHQLFDFQRHLVEWSLRKGRAAVWADCGLGKSLMALAWADNVCRHTGGRVLIITPLAVAAQFVREGQKFGIDVEHSRDGKFTSNIVVTNEVFGAVINGRKAVGVELKPTYYRQAVENVNRALHPEFKLESQHSIVEVIDEEEGDFDEDDAEEQ